MIYDNTQNILIEIRKIMIEKNISIKELSHRIGKSSAATSALLKQKNISLDSLNDVCKALECKLYIDIK